MNPTPHSNADTYEVESILGKGGMGVVYLAHDKRLNRKVAIKCIRQNRANEHWVEAVQEEAKLLAQINHTNIVQIYDLIDWQGVPALVMEYVCGRTLLDVLNSDELQSDAINFNQRLDWLKQIAEGLACAHAKGIIHRDLKPENIMIASDGTVKIMDFGIARHQAQPKHTNIHDSQVLPGEFVGSPGSLSPEQALGEDLTTASDVFSFGILAYSLMCGHHPFGDTSDTDTLLHSILYRAPAPFRFNVESDERGQEIAEIIEQSLQKKAKSRPTAANMAVAFNPLPAKKVETVSMEKESRKSLFVSMGIAAGAVLALIAVVSIWAGQTLGLKTQHLVILAPSYSLENVKNTESVPLLLAAVDNTIQEALLDQKNVQLINREEIAPNSAIAEAGITTGASAVITTQIKCRHSRCEISLEKFSAPEWKLTNKESWPVYLLDSSSDIYYTTWQHTLELLDSPQAAPSRIDDEDYLWYLSTLERFNSSYNLPDSEIIGLNNLIDKHSKFKPAYRLLTLASIANYHQSNDSNRLAQALIVIGNNSGNLTEEMQSELKANVYLTLKQFAQAQEEIDKLRKLSQLDTYYILSTKLALEKNDYGKAESLYSAQFESRNSAEFLYGKAFAQYMQGKTPEASKSLNQLLGIMPNHLAANSFLAAISVESQNLDLARELYQRIISIEKSSVELNNLAMIFLLEGNYQQAIDTQLEALTLSPKNPIQLVNLGELYKLIDEQEKAEFYFKEAIKNSRSSDSIELIANTIKAYIHLNDLDSASKLLEKGLNIESENFELNYAKALLQIKSHLLEDAIYNVTNLIDSGYAAICLAFPGLTNYVSLKRIKKNSQEKK